MFSAPLKRQDYLIIIMGFGFLLGCLSVFSPGSVFCLCLFLLVMLGIYFYACEEDKGFLMKLFTAGVLLRVAVLLLISVIYAFFNKWNYQPDGTRAIAFMGDRGDSSIYTVRGWWIVQYFLGKPLSQRVINAISNTYGHSGHLYVMALFYSLFGFSPVSVTLLNCIASVSTGILFYFMTKEVAGRQEAKIASFLITFFPSLVLWSVTNLKDTMFIFLSGVILWSFMKFALADKTRYRYLIFFIISVLIQFSYRNVFLIPTILTAGATLFFIRKKRSYVFPWILILIASPLIFKIGLPLLKNNFVAHHRGVISTGGFIYRLFDDWVYAHNFTDFGSVSNFIIAKAFLKGVVHFFLEPFPWRISSHLSILAFPQTIVWYFLLTFAIIGIIVQLRYNWQKNLFFLTYLFSTGSILIMAGGNVGTDFRFRDILTPIIILFAAIGVCKAFYGGYISLRNENSFLGSLPDRRGQ